MNAYSVHDVKAMTYSLPFFRQGDPLAERDFSLMVTEAGSLMSRFPRDFRLFHVGEYDEETAHYTSCDPRLVADGAAYTGDLAHDEA